MKFELGGPTTLLKVVLLNILNYEIFIYVYLLDTMHIFNTESQSTQSVTGLQLSA